MCEVRCGVAGAQLSGVASSRGNGRYIGRMPSKLKVSLSLSPEVLALVDRAAKQRKHTRSAVVEQWLRRAVTTEIEQTIEQATAEYYQSLRVAERAADESLSKALSRAARRVSYDEGAAPRRGRAQR